MLDNVLLSLLLKKCPRKFTQKDEFSWTKCPREFTKSVHENSPILSMKIRLSYKRVYMFFQKEFYPIVLRFFEMFSTCKAGIMPYAHGVLHMTKEDSIFSLDTVTDTAKNCPENIAKNIYPTNPNLTKI